MPQTFFHDHWSPWRCAGCLGKVQENHRTTTDIATDISADNAVDMTLDIAVDTVPAIAPDNRGSADIDADIFTYFASDMRVDVPVAITTVSMGCCGHPRTSGAVFVESRGLPRTCQRVIRGKFMDCLSKRRRPGQLLNCM